MNKFVILALFACVATAIAGPSTNDNEILLGPKDKETANMGPRMIQIFSDFCMEARAKVEEWLDGSVDKSTYSRLFEVMSEAGAKIDSDPHAEIKIDDVKAIFKGMNDQLTNEHLQDSVDGFCDQVTNSLEYELDTNLLNYKWEHYDFESPQQFYGIKLHNLGCLTASRVSKINIICVLRSLDFYDQK